MALRWFKDRELAGHGKLAFRCPHHGLKARERGPFVLFADVVSDQKGDVLVESNAAAVLAAVAPPQP